MKNDGCILYYYDPLMSVTFCENLNRMKNKKKKKIHDLIALSASLVWFSNRLFTNNSDVQPPKHVLYK